MSLIDLSMNTENVNKEPPQYNSILIPDHCLQKALPQQPPTDLVTDDVGSLKGFEKELNNDCLFSIMQFLPVASLCSLSAVSKFWQQQAERDEVWAYACGAKLTSCKLTTMSLKSVYLKLNKERILHAAEVNLTKEYEYCCFWGTCHPPRFTQLPPLYVPKGSALSQLWPAHPNSVSSYAPNTLVTDLQVSSYSEFYLTFELLFQKDSNLLGCYSQESGALAALQRYVQFHKLKSKYPDHLLIPTHDIVMVWITHLIRPEKYESDCKTVFGYNDLPAIPYELDSASIALRDYSLKSTSDLWQKEFGTAYITSGFRTEEEIEAERLRNSRFVYNDSFHAGTSMRTAVPFKGRSTPYFYVSVPTQPSPTIVNPLSITEQDVVFDRQFFERYCTFLAKFGTNTYCHLSQEFHSKELASGTKSYERFMYLVAKNPTNAHQLFPPYDADFIWHSHMLDPSAYRAYCMKYLGFVLSHDPSDSPSASTAKSLQNLWKEEYGEVKGNEASCSLM